MQTDRADADGSANDDDRKPKHNDKKHKDKKHDKLKGKDYAKELERLHGELVTLQQWVVHEGVKVCVIFEGRDGAGKGGTIKAITERVSPRVFRVVALPAPTEREKTQMYIQRYLPHLPAAGEIVIFDRSWYNRAGVERVMGFASEEQVEKFLNAVPLVERAIVDSGVKLIKYWLEVSPEEQTKRLNARMDDPRKIWKLSPMDLKSYSRWYDYSRARDEMFAATDTALRAVVRGALGRQEARAAQRHPASARADPVQEAQAREDRAAGAPEAQGLSRARLPLQVYRRGLTRRARSHRPRLYPRPRARRESALNICTPRRPCRRETNRCGPTIAGRPRPDRRTPTRSSR